MISFFRFKTADFIFSIAHCRGICGSDEDIITHVEPLINPLVSGYKELYDRQKRLEKLKEGKKDEFFGLRDFYRFALIAAVSLINLFRNLR